LKDFQTPDVSSFSERENASMSIIKIFLFSFVLGRPEF
jgi:hypothetical protein